MKRISFLLVVSLLIGCGGGGSSDPGTTSLALSVPTVTSGAASNITVNSADIGATVNPGNDPTSACIEWGTASDLSPYSSTSTQSIGADNTNHIISATLTGLTDNTTIYYRVRAWNSLGTVRGQILSFTTLSNMVTITFDSISNGDSVIIFCNNIEVSNFYNDTGANATTSYVGPAGPANKYKFIRIIDTQTAAGFPISIVDVNDNNVFQLNAGGQLTVQYQLSSAIGRAQYYITGTGFTASYQAPGNVGGNWNTHSLVDNSTNGNIPVGTTQDALVTCVQNEFQVLKVLSGLGTVFGTTNGDLVYFWFWGGTDPLWLKTWRDTWLINSASTAFTGDGMETWQARSGPDFFYTHWNATGTR